MDSLAEAESASQPKDAPPASLAPGSLAAQWERVLSTPRGTQRARMSFSVALALLVLLAGGAGWQAVVHSSLGARLRGMNAIAFVGGNDPNFAQGNDLPGGASVDSPSTTLPQLYVMQPDGSGLRQLTNLAHGFYFSPVWSPDGSRLAAFQVANTHNAVADLVVMAADGSDMRVISSVTFSLDAFNQLAALNFFSGSIMIDWSPDGKQLVAWLSVGQYMLVNADGTHPRVLNGLLPVWSPDGRYLAYYVNVPANQNAPQDGSGAAYTIELLDTQTSASRLFNGLPGLNAEALAWSPDGRYLAASASWGNNFQSVPADSILLVGRDGTCCKTVERWTSDQVEQVAWSPDSQKLAVVLQDFTLEQQNGNPSGGSSVVEVVNTDGSHIQRLGSSDGGQPSWSPDGKQLIYANADDTSLLIATLAQPGQGIRSLTESLALLFAPSWSPLAGV